MEATANKMRAAFAEVARGLMEWEDPPQTPYVCTECGHGFSGPYVRCIGTDGLHAPRFPQPREGTRFYRPRGKQETPEYVEPLDVQTDWEERG